MTVLKPKEELDFDNLVCVGNVTPAPDWRGVRSATADAGWGLVEGDKLYAFCSAWLRDTPAYGPYDSCTLGHFFAADRESGRRILEHAMDYLSAHGKNHVIGPMNGNTWQSYRFITEDSGYPRFFLEPDSAPFWPDVFVQSGFSAVAEYTSALSESIDYRDAASDRTRENIDAIGLNIRPFNPESSETDLEAVYRLSVKSFSRNFLYTDIKQEEFMGLYRQIVPYVVPDFFKLVEDKGQVVAYIFAIPDYAQKQRGETVDTLIVKTVARSPEQKYAGLGHYLVHHVHHLAAGRGFKRVIHALMHEDNASRRISNKSALTIRRYGLYGREL